MLPSHHLHVVHCSQVLDDIVSGEALVNPGCLSRFLLLVFGDLKAQRFVHWFAHPTLAPRTPFLYSAPLAPLAWPVDAVRSLQAGVAALATACGGTVPPFFLVDPNSEWYPHPAQPPLAYPNPSPCMLCAKALASLPRNE